MLPIIGLVVVFGSIIGGFLEAGGHLAVLIQPAEFIIIGGAGLGSFIVGNPMSVIKASGTQLMALLKPNPYTEEAYGELLQTLYNVFQKARKDGLVGLEAHIEEPHKSDIFTKYPGFMHHEDAVAMLCDTLKVLLTGAVEDHHLEAILDADLEQQHVEASVIPASITKVGDAMPGFGIVAAVLGIINTMNAIGGEASAIGEKVGAALVGTFIGILLAYGVVGPIAQAMEGRIRSHSAYMLCIKTALLAFARGDSPMSAVEFARRNIEPEDRPSFAELENLTRRKAA